MPKGYVIVTGTIHDPEGMKAYNRLASRTISEGGGKWSSWWTPNPKSSRVIGVAAKPSSSSSRR